MFRFVLQRVLFACLTFFAIVTVVFFLLRAAPGGPFDGERPLPPQVEQNLRAAYNLDVSLLVQYAQFLRRLSQGDLGPSFKQKDFSVNQLIRSGLPVSAGLGILALLLALSVGMLIGIVAGYFREQAVDRWLMGISNLNLALPTIVAAPIMVLLFSVTFKLFPAGGADSAWHFILPAIALALPFSAEIARLLRGGMAEARDHAHVRTARAKGLSPVRIIVGHMLPVACLPMISYLAPAFAGLLTGSVVVEQVFDLPGIGNYFINGALNRDYTLVMGVTIVYALAILILNLFADLLYGWMDPRIRVALQSGSNP